MLGIPLGIFTILLGAKGFSESGIPLTSKKNLHGSTAKSIGFVCILLGVFFLIAGFHAVSRL